MNQHTAADIIERLDGIASHLCKLDKIVTQLTRLTRITKETKETIMVTKEELNAALDAVSTEITKLGDDLAAQLATLEAQIAAGGDVSDSLAKANAIAAKLQAIDDTLPERPA
jgi:hypothetical protein